MRDCSLHHHENSSCRAARRGILLRCSSPMARIDTAALSYWQRGDRVAVMNTHGDLVEARFSLNMARIRGLVKLIFSDIVPMRTTDPFQSEGTRADILRAIVVFLHATFEDVLRSMARQRIAASQSLVLDDIPLVGTSRSGRAEKFLLGELDGHRGKTVDQLIQESVENYFDRKSFSSIREVHQILTQMGLDTVPFKPLFADLDQMMKRRHRIVHEADLPSPTAVVSAPWTIDDDLDLMRWLLVVPTFCRQLYVSVDPKAEVARWSVAKWLKTIDLAREARAEILALLNQRSGEARHLALLKANERMAELAARLGAEPSTEELVVMWKSLKSSDDDTTEEQARAAIVAWRDTGKV